MFFFFKQKTAYEMRISDWSSDVCSSDLYKNKQEQGFTGSQVFLQNTGPVKLYGLDFDTSYRVYHDLTARAALTWVPQAKYRNFDDALAYRPTLAADGSFTGVERIQFDATDYGLPRAARFMGHVELLDRRGGGEGTSV